MAELHQIHEYLRPAVAKHAQQGEDRARAERQQWLEDEQEQIGLFHAFAALGFVGVTMFMAWYSGVAIRYAVLWIWGV